MRRVDKVLVVAVMFLGVVVGVAAVGAAWGEAGDAPAAGGGPEPESVADLGGDLYLGRPIAIENVTAWPVYSRQPADPVGRDFVTLAEAEARGEAVVREVGMVERQAPIMPAAQQAASRRRPQLQMNQLANANEADDGQYVERAEPAGRVNELVLENRGKRPILVLAGTLVKGGRQDRQVGQDFIVGPGKTVAIDAFCVEHGRWTATRDGVATGGVFKSQPTLSTKAVRSAAQFKGDQQAVWDNVAATNSAAGKAPSSGTLMATIEDGDREATARRARIARALSEGFATLARAPHPPVGLAYAIDGKLREVRSFSHPALFDRLVETLVNTVAIEGDLAQRQARASGRPAWAGTADARQVVALVRAVAAAPEKRAQTKAGNVNGTRKGAAGWSAECFDGEKAARPVTQNVMSAD